jgi:hypothetical protein
MSNVWAHDIMERMRLRRKIEARHMGLGDIDVGTFPSHPPNVVINEGGGASKLLTGLLLAAAGGGGVLGLVSLLTPALSSPTPVVAPADKSVSSDQKNLIPSEFIYDIEIMSVDGELKVDATRVDGTD